MSKLVFHSMPFHGWIIKEKISSSAGLSVFLCLPVCWLIHDLRLEQGSLQKSWELTDSLSQKHEICYVSATPDRRHPGEG